MIQFYPVQAGNSAIMGMGIKLCYCSCTFFSVFLQQKTVNQFDLLFFEILYDDCYLFFI